MRSPFEPTLHCSSQHSDTISEYLLPSQDGVFHYNTLLTLDLASPYFSSGRQEERFEVVVMEHKEDGHVRLGDPRLYSKLGISAVDEICFNSKGFR